MMAVVWRGSQGLAEGSRCSDQRVVVFFFFSSSSPSAASLARAPVCFVSPLEGGERVHPQGGARRGRDAPASPASQRRPPAFVGSAAVLMWSKGLTPCRDMTER